MLFRLLAGFFGGLLFTVAVFYLVCDVLAPFSNLCGHNTPVTAVLVWAASCAAIWIVLFAWPEWRKVFGDYSHDRQGNSK